MIYRSQSVILRNSVTIVDLWDLWLFAHKLRAIQLIIHDGRECERSSEPGGGGGGGTPL